MKIPWALVAAPLVIVPVLLVGPSGEAAPAKSGIVTMGHEEFGTKAVTIHVGDRLTFTNDSAWLHVLVSGSGAHIREQDGIPDLGYRNAQLFEHGARWTTGPWLKPGTYELTCQLHREMTVKVVVLP